MSSEERNLRTNTDAFYAELGRRISVARRQKNLTQEQLAEVIDLSRTSLTNIERGGQKILVHKLCEIATELGVSAEVLIPSPKNLPIRNALDNVDPSKRDVLSRALEEISNRRNT